MAAIATTQTERVAFKKIPQAGLIAAVTAAVLNVVIYFIGNAMGGMKLPLTPVLVAVFSILGITIGGVIFALLGRFTKRPITIFTIISIVFLVLYAFAPEALQRVMDQIEPYGLFIVFALVLGGGAGGILTHLNQMVLNLLP